MTENTRKLEGLNTACWVCGREYSDEKHRMDCINSPVNSTEESHE